MDNAVPAQCVPSKELIIHWLSYDIATTMMQSAAILSAGGTSLYAVRLLSHYVHGAQPVEVREALTSLVFQPRSGTGSWERWLGFSNSRSTWLGIKHGPMQFVAHVPDRRHYC